MKDDMDKKLLWIILIIAIIVIAVIMINQKHKPSSILNEDTTYILM